MTPFKRKGLRKALFVFSVSFLSIAAFSSSVFALDPHKRITQYDMRLYQAEHGLPMNDMKVVFQDSKGYIWLGCQEGLVRFDGVRFVLFDKSKYPGLRENFIWDIKEDWEGNLWVATNGGGVSRFDGKTFTTYDTSDGLTHNIVRCILITRDRAIWFGTEDGLSCYKNGKFTNRRLAGNSIETQQIYCLLEDDSGHLIVGKGDNDLDVLIDGEFQKFPINSSNVRSLFKRRSGEILVGTGEGRVYVYRDGRINKFHPHHLPTNHPISAIHEDRDGNLWFCIDGNGILRYYANRFESLKLENILPQNYIFINRTVDWQKTAL